MVIYPLGRNFIILKEGDVPFIGPVKNIIALAVDSSGIADENGDPLTHPSGNLDDIPFQTLLPFSKPLTGVTCTKGKIIVYL